MNNLIHADIFFFITTIIAVILGILFIFVLYYVISILRKFKQIAEKIKQESDNVAEDIENLRAKMKEDGLKFSFLVGMFSKILKFRNLRKTSSRKSKNNIND